MQHYAAVRLNRIQVKHLNDDLQRELYARCSDNETLVHETYDFVMSPQGVLWVEDCGVMSAQAGRVIDFGNSDGSENALKWLTREKQ